MKELSSLRNQPSVDFQHSGECDRPKRGEISDERAFFLTVRNQPSAVDFPSIQVNAIGRNRNMHVHDVLYVLCTFLSSLSLSLA
jgi:hypothetical protein